MKEEGPQSKAQPSQRLEIQLPPVQQIEIQLPQQIQIAPEQEIDIEELEPEEEAVDPKEIEDARKEIIARCKAADILIEEISDQDSQPELRLALKCGRGFRKVTVPCDKYILGFRQIQFEKFVFLTEYGAICSYTDGYIEALLRPLGANFPSATFMLRRLFDQDIAFSSNSEIPMIKLAPPQAGFPHIELSRASWQIAVLSQPSFPERFSRTLSLKLTDCTIATHDKAISLLEKTANALFLQADLLTGVALGLDRERRPPMIRRPFRKANIISDLQYPKNEVDNAPISLYWYARSATGMPLLQFLAFYQVIEFYFPTYAKAEAQRRLKAILKDPTFRGDRYADVGRLLSVIQVNRAGAFGDERSQLRATIAECIDPNELREFLESSERKEFYTSKGMGQAYHRIPLANQSADLRNDVADRIYSIRCGIVHTKDDGDGNGKQLLPFSSEAQQLFWDIDLVQYVARKVLFTGSTPYQPNV
jgi:hypothetical protein